jgi:hypothetical protein
MILYKCQQEKYKTLQKNKKLVDKITQMSYNKYRKLIMNQNKRGILK